jgi:transposase
MNNAIYNVKLTDKEVYRILFLNKVKGMQPHQLEEMFPVSKGTIRNIVNGKSRKDCYHAFMYYMEKHPKKVQNLF